jgi:LysM repeat protein
MRLILCGLILLYSTVSAEKGTVELPLVTWEQMVDKIENSTLRPSPTQSFCPISRSIVGKVRKGLFKGTLTTQFVVFDSVSSRIPVIDGNATLGDVVLNGSRTSLYRENDMFTIGITKPGMYTLISDIIIGKEVDRFDRQLTCMLPDGGPTRVSIEIPEKNIDPVLNNGALVSISEVPDGTRFEGNLNAGGKLDLTWTRKLSHDVNSRFQSELSMYTLFTVQEALISGQTQCNVSIIDGETDRIDLLLPDNIEITGVSGDAVLQWRTDRAQANRLSVLLRHLVQDQVSMTISFQLPVRNEQAIEMESPYPDSGTVYNSVTGVLSAGGLDVQVKNPGTASQIDIRDLPQELTSMTTSPLLFGFTSSENTSITIAIARNKDVALTGTIIDDLQASTIITQDGQEITKMKLRIRNNNRQYLKLTLPADAYLTHSLIDGMPLRPALSKEKEQDVLLFPLQQSEAIHARNHQYHTVQPGETLSDIAELYYSDPSKASFILENNQDVIANDNDIQAGQPLYIPQQSAIKIRESSFIIELAYKIPSRKEIGSFGKRSIRLASLDIETVQSLWYLYFPNDLDIISVSSNMKQLTAVRYNIFIRARDFLRNALVKNAWAGGNYYSNILVQRKAIYKADYAKKSREESVTTSFPLVGSKYRFRRNLSGTETPYISILYMPAWISISMHWIGFALSVILVLFLLKNIKNKKKFIHGIVYSIVLLLIGFYIQGMYRRLLWGVDCALLITIFRLIWPGLIANFRSVLQMPWSISKVVTWLNIVIIIALSLVLGFILSFPMFLSSTLLILLIIWKRYLAYLEMKVKL